MNFCVSRSGQSEEASDERPGARAAVRLLRDWAITFPQQYLVLRDESGTPLAYRRPHPKVMPPSSAAAHLPR